MFVSKLSKNDPDFKSISQKYPLKWTCALTDAYKGKVMTLRGQLVFLVEPRGTCEYVQTSLTTMDQVH